METHLNGLRRTAVRLYISPSTQIKPVPMSILLSVTKECRRLLRSSFLLPQILSSDCYRKHSVTEPETRNQKPETRNQKPETRNQKPETRNQKPETRNQKQETRNQKPPPTPTCQNTHSPRLNFQEIFNFFLTAVQRIRLLRHHKLPILWQRGGVTFLQKTTLIYIG